MHLCIGHNHSMTKEIAVVTGASSGIGAATAKLLAKNGYHVIAAARRLDLLSEVAKASPDIEVVELDVTDEKSVAALAKKLEGQPVSVLVNNAGGAFDGTRFLIDYELAGTDLDDARLVRRLIVDDHLAGVLLWRNYAQQGGPCGTTTNMKIAMLALGRLK